MIHNRFASKLRSASRLFMASAAFFVAILVSRASLGTVPVDVVSSEASGAATSCNGADTQLADNQRQGIGYFGDVGLGLFANPVAQDWRAVLALLYGGVDLTAPGTPADCNSAARQTLAANWTKLFQDGSTCTGDVTNCGPGTPANGGIWHAFRPDDGSEAAQTFADAIGLTPAPSKAFLSGGFVRSPFGRSPYCNAMNWDSTIPLDASGAPAYDSWPTLGNLSGNSLYPASYDNSICAIGPHDQFVGPGGVDDPSSVAGTCTTSGHCEGTTAQPLGAACTVGGTSCANGSPCLADLCRTNGATTCAGQDACVHVPHRMPPPGITTNRVDPPPPGTPPGTPNVGGQVWGSAPLGISGTQAWDVLPTGMQDNDPIRRPCIGGVVSNSAHTGEEVCNMDGSLGLVLPIVETDSIVGASFNGGPAISQYPTLACNGAWTFGEAPQVINCAMRNSAHHDGECPNGDKLFGGLCAVPYNNTAGTSACANSAGQTPPLSTGSRTLPRNYGRVYNLQMRDGRVTQGVKFAQYQVPEDSVSVDFLGAFYRIHETETVVPGAPDCQQAVVAEQISCLSSADSCSVGVTFDGVAQNWNNPPPQLTDGLRINQIYPSDPGYPTGLTCHTNPDITEFQMQPVAGVGYSVVMRGGGCPNENASITVLNGEQRVGLSGYTAASDGSFTTTFSINNSSLCGGNAAQLLFEVAVANSVGLQETDFEWTPPPC